MSPATGTIADLTPPETKFEFKATRPVVARARVVQPPADKNDVLVVALNNYSSIQEYKVEPGRWTQAATGLPQEAWTCVVLFDDDGDIWVSRWDDVQDNSEPDNIIFHNPALDGSKGYILWEPDVKLYRQQAASLTLDEARFFSRRGAVSNTSFAARVIGEGNDRLVIRADGRILTGGGTTATDLNLYRESVGTVPEPGWKTDQHLMVGTSLRVGDPDIKQYSGQFSAALGAGETAKIGELTFQSASQNICAEGIVKFQNGGTGGRLRFVVWLRSNTLPSKSITVLNFPDPGNVFTMKARAWEDATTGRIVIGVQNITGAMQNYGWTLSLQERADYNYFVPVTSHTLLDATALTGLTEAAGNTTYDAVVSNAGKARFGVGASFISSVADNLIFRSNYNWETDRLVDTSKPSWGLAINDASDRFVILRAPATAGAPTYAEFAYFNNAGTIRFANMVQIPYNFLNLERVNDGESCLWVNKAGDSNYRMHVDNLGVISWGSGAGAGDVNFGRNGVGLLESSGKIKATQGFVTPTVTSLPASPVDGQECYYVVDATNGIVWHLKYRAASASAYKWECVGGSPMFAEITSNESTLSTTYVDLGTVGPSLTVPLAGDYDIEGGCRAYMSATGSAELFMAVKMGAAATVDTDLVHHVLRDASTAAQAMGSTGTKPLRRTGLTASQVLKAQYRVTAGTGSFTFRWMKLRPVRVG